MRSILTIALTDLRALFRQPSTFISVFAVPIGITIVLGLVFSGGNSGPAGTIYIVRIGSTAFTPTMPESGPDPIGQKFAELLRAEAGSEYIICDLGASEPAQPSACNLEPNDQTQVLSRQASLGMQRTLAEDRIKNNVGVYPVAVVIPENFTADLQAGKNITVEYLAQPGLNANQLTRQKVDAALTQLNGAIAAARAVTNGAAPSTDQRQAVYDSAYQSAISIWATNPVTVTDQISGLTQGAVQAQNGFSQSAPGMGAMFVLSSVLGLGIVFITERQNWTLQRLMLMPMARWQLLAGKLLGRYVLGVIIFAVMLAVGSAFGVRWGDLGGVVVTVLAYVLAVTAIGLAFSTLVRSRGQAQGVALLLTLTLTPLGGAWWSLDIVPDWMRTIGHLSPIAWSQDAFASLLYHNGHLLDVLPAIGVLLIFATVFFAFGLSRFKYE